MAPTPGASELFDTPTVGRTFTSRRSVRLGDVDTTGRLRLDSTSRYLQDVATDDAGDAELDGRQGWVVRRTMMDVAAPPRLDETLEITTFCTGLGRSWAERSTVVVGDQGGSIRSVSLWVQIDVETGRPTALTPQFLDIYGEACGDRRVSARLSLGRPGAGYPVCPWPIRRVDLDPFDHVNNAANWAFVEEAADFARTGRSRRVLAEMEFVAPVTSDVPVDLCTPVDSSAVFEAWLVHGDTVLSAARLTAP